MSVWLWVGLGGALGACARFGIGQVVPVALVGGAAFPWPTFVANALGAGCIGLAIGALSEQLWFNDFGRAFLVTGVLGGFTTFSAFSLEMVQLAQAGHVGTAVGYALMSLLVCAIGAWVGLSVGSSL